LIPFKELRWGFDRFKGGCLNKFSKITPPEAVGIDLAEAYKEGIEPVKLLKGEVQLQVLRDRVIHKEEDLCMPRPLM
jgi:hypothetical protein